MELKVIQSDGEYTHVALSGRLDIDGVNQIELSFVSAINDKEKPAVVDMTQVSFLSSFGMRMLLSAAKALRTKGMKLVLFHPQPMVLEALQTAGFSAIMPIENDFINALSALKC